jgi:signal transduction histidine kinase
MAARRRRRSLRLRITAGSLILVVVALCGAGFLLITVVQRKMVSDLDATLRANAGFIERAVQSGTPLPSGAGPTDLYVQFLSADGRVVGASTAAQGRPALVDPVHGNARRAVTVDDRELGDLRAIAEPSPVDHTGTLVVARSASGVASVRDSLIRLLGMMLVAGSALLGVLVWAVVGRALQPVDEMRKTVDAISERDLHRRLDRPRTGDELDRLADTLNDLLARLDVALSRERQFVGDASHELRTPIAAVRALLETEPSDPASVVRLRAEVLERLAQLQDLVDELLVLAQADGAAIERCTRPVDLDELVLAQARQLRRTTDLRIDTAEVSGGQIAARDTDIARVIENLATNAARHAETAVGFSVRQIDGVVELGVTDDGPGIAPADRARVFERFHRVDGGRGREDGGAGLGLSIARAIVDAHGGSIRAEGAPGAGARFVVTLPRAPQNVTTARHP